MKEDGNFFLMQFTGLKDKNGVDVYDGDLIKIKGDIDVYQIKWSDGAFCWKAECDRDGSIVFLDELICSHHPKGHEFKLIGNIHQSPELITDNKG
ncbi:MAG TPA: hypothetical protein EYN54_11710 [Methylococcaceae bacterium]|nr:hypothetical protein [Methylococcaceae bacterium]